MVFVTTFAVFTFLRAGQPIQAAIPPGDETVNAGRYED
jgi:hypothetical protein